jgi:biopolymer transport protein ExbD
MARKMRRHHYRRLRGEPPNLDMTTFMNLMVVLTPFLLITAVFSRITIINLELPSSASRSVSEPTFRLEVIVRKEGYELTNGSSLIATIPKVGDAYDLKTLSRLALSLKQDYPDASNASVLLEPDIEYDQLIHAMDAIRSVELPANSELLAGLEPAAAPADEAKASGGAIEDKKGTQPANLPVTRVALFTDIAVGDAP